MESKQIFFIDKNEKLSIELDGNAIDQINSAVEYLVEQYGGKEKFFGFAKEMIDNGAEPKPGLETHICVLSSIIALYEKSAFDSKKVKTRSIDESGNMGEIKDLDYNQANDINEN
jgi:hypothetical protein